VGRVFRLGLRPVNATAQFYGNAVRLSGGSPWGMRLQIAFLFPKLPPELKDKLRGLQKKRDSATSTAASRMSPWLVSEREHRDRRLSKA
jgi:hypothetical protein